MPIKKIPELLYKFLPLYKEGDITSSKGLLCSCVKGNLKFSSIHDLNDASEEFVATDLAEMGASLESILAVGCSSRQRKKLKRQFLLWMKFNPQIKIPQGLIDDLLPILPQLVSKKHGHFDLSRLKDLMQTINISPKDSQIRGLAQNLGLESILENLPQLENKGLFQFLSDLAQITVDDFFKKSGILSLSAKLDSFPMWAHYANNAMGFAVEYENLDKYFKGDDTGVLNKLGKVKYKEKRPPLTLNPSDLSEVFFNKLIDWKYEQEYRVVRTFADCEPKSTEKGQIYVHQIPSEYIKRIIVGWNVAKDDFEQIKKIVEKECPKISVVQACVEHGLIKTNEEKRVR